MLLVVQAFLDELLGRAHRQRDDGVAQLDLRLLRLDLEILTTLGLGDLGLLARLGHDAGGDARGDAFALLDGFLDALALERLDLAELVREVRLQALGLAELLLGRGVVALDLVAPLVELVEDRAPGEFAP